MKDETPSFNFSDERSEIADAVDHPQPADRALLEDQLDWHEVPQAVFLSWSDAMQWNYCARRDEDAALRTDDEAEQLFYLKRAQSYRELIH